ncbi:MAG: mechanosensitive ion channel family protein [Actinomycetota bacterium]
MLAALTAAVLAQDAARFTADWWRDAALGFAIVLVVALVLSVGTRRYVRRQQRAADRAEDDANGRRARRRATVVGLIGGTLQLVLWFVVLLMFLGKLGVPLGPVFASAGVVGVALGFGAQTVVKDTLAGLFIALEGQFDVGDVLDLQTEGGPLSGTVEGLTLRVTTVRQYDGTHSVVPNGSIQVTSNKTRGWGRAIVDVRVALSEDPEKVRAVLEELFAEISDADPLKPWLRDEPKVLGVTQLTDVAQVIRAVVETLPNHRFDTERYLRERISMRMTERGIKVPPISPGRMPDAGL